MPKGSKQQHQRVLALDGHDGAGKTTLARLVADSLGGRYVKPFDGTLGDMVIWLHECRRFELASELARASVEKAMLANSDSSLLIFDRHWMSMFTLFPSSLRREWFPLPITILCWADLQTTLDRLSQRGEEPGNHLEHDRFIQLYKQMAEEFDVPLVDTSLEPLEASLARILKISEEMGELSCI